jgi:tripartite-type tricarboxylate transporter receptor subunit TctC
MRKNKLTVLCLLLLTVGLALNLAWGDDYPSKPINFLIPFGAGGSADLMGRALANGAETYLGQPIVPINKPGAGG